MHFSFQGSTNLFFLATKIRISREYPKLFHFFTGCTIIKTGERSIKVVLK